MRAIDRKLFRDLWQLRGQALAIILVIASGVATYVMFVSTLDSLCQSRDSYYRDYRFAELFVSLKRAPNALKARLAEIPGVRGVEGRVVAPVTVDIPDFPEPVTGRVTSVPNQGPAAYNALYLRQGRLPDGARDDELVIGEPFAEAHRLQPGDRLDVTIRGTRKRLRIVGIALSPEYVSQLRPGSAFPDYERYGVMWMAERPLAAVYDMEGAFNSLVLGLGREAIEKDVIGRVDELLKPYGGQGAYAREHQASHRFLAEEFNQLANMAGVFPVIFLGVAAFLLNVVINRLVGMQREQIASLKAFGYSNLDVGLHYFKLVVAIVALGALLGTALGAWLGEALARLYIEFYRLPYLHFTLRPDTLLAAVVISLAAALSGTWFAVRGAVRLRPAEAMQPEPPARYRRSVIERLGLARLLSQPSRMILRHLGHRPFKSLLSVIGIALSGAIMMTGEFQQDTVSYMLDVHYGLSQRGDMSVTFAEVTSRRAIHELRGIPGVEHVEPFRGVPVTFRFEHRSYRSAIEGVVEGATIRRLLDAELNPIRVPKAGIVLTDYLAELLHVRPGDTITVELLEGSRAVREVPVVALVNEYLGLSGYMDLEALNRFMREGSAISGAFLTADKAYYPEIFRRIKETPGVAGLVIRENEINSFNRTMEETMLFFTFIASLFAGVIAFGVVYNTARIALTERSRELASMRVLGFTRGEISYILLGELAVLTLAAIPLGLYLGRGLCGYIASTLQNELYRVPLILEPATYATAALVVLVASIASALLVRRQLDRLDLIAVLKTKE